MAFDEENYEDELDRMRARKQRKKQVNFPVSDPADEDFQFYEDLSEIVPDDDEDFGEEYEEEYEYEPEPVSEKRKKRIKSVSNAGAAGYRKKKRKRFGFLKVLLLAVLFLIGFYLYKNIREDGYWNIAVFGVDSRDGNLGKGALSDVEMICSINKKTGELRLVSVFRDSYLKIDNDDNYHKINEAYFKGGREQAVTALEQNLDLRIDDYATFNWKAVVDAINVLGGIDLEITDKEFAYINSFITETVNSTGVGSYQLDHSGMNHLDGVQAVAYARLRLMDTDFNRTERQRKVLSLAMDKAKAADFKTLKTLIGAVYPQVATSIGVDDLIVVAKNARKYYIGQTTGFPFSHTEMKIKKMDCVVPTTLESNVVQLHEFLYGDSGYTPSGMVKKISGHIIEVSGLGDPGKDIESGRTNGSQPSGGSKTPAATEAPRETQPPETESASESEEETSESESIEETTIDALESPQEATDASESEEGTAPGITATTAAEEPTTAQEAPETTLEAPRETTGALEGPGQGVEPEGEVVGPGI